MGSGGPHYEGRADREKLGKRKPHPGKTEQSLKKVFRVISGGGTRSLPTEKKLTGEKVQVVKKGKEGSEEKSTPSAPGQCSP